MKNTAFENLRSICLNFIIFSVPIAFLFFIFPTVFRMLLPFFIGIIIASLCRPFFSFLAELRLPRGIAAFLSLLITAVIIGGIVWFSLSKTVKELSGFSENFAQFYEASSRSVNSITMRLGNIGDNRMFSGGLSEGINAFMYKMGESIENHLSDIVSSVTNGIIESAKNIPSVIIFLFTSLLSAFFILKDRELLADFIKKNMPDRYYALLKNAKCSVFCAFASYLRAQLLISAVMFFVLLCGFFILRIKYALLVALLTAFIDAVPVLGTGTVLIPWAMLMIFSDNSSLGWGLLTLYGVCVLVRQLCEPKIIGTNLGIHPLLTIFSIYTGIRIFGFFGFILGPVTALLIKNLINPKIS